MHIGQTGNHKLAGRRYYLGIFGPSYSTFGPDLFNAIPLNDDNRLFDGRMPCAVNDRCALNDYGIGGLCMDQRAGCDNRNFICLSPLNDYCLDHTRPPSYYRKRTGSRPKRLSWWYLDLQQILTKTSAKMFGIQFDSIARPGKPGGIRGV
jgi:hypothetical protein